MCFNAVAMDAASHHSHLKGSEHQEARSGNGVSAIALAARLSAYSPGPELLSSAISVEPSGVLAVARRHGIEHLALRGARLLGLAGYGSLDRRAQTLDQLGKLSELIRVQGLLRTAGIQSLAYKGAALAGRIYGELGLRPFADVDLLIARKDAAGAGEALRRAGYIPEFELAPAEKELFPHESCQADFRHSSSGLLIEMHWAILSRPFALEIDAEPFFGQATTTDIAGVSLPVPCDEDLLLALFAHGTKHAWGGLKWLADIAWFMAREPDFDWLRLVERATALRMRRIVATALILVRDFFLVPLPTPVVGLINDDPVAAKLARQISRMISAGEVPETRIAWLHLFWTRVREHPTDRVRVAVRLMSDPTIDFRRRTHLGPAMDWLNRPLRVFHVIGRGTMRSISTKVARGRRR